MRTNKVLVYILTLSLGLGLFGLTGSTSANTVTRVYDASKDFTGVQGQNQWYYQKLSGTVYTDLTYNSSNKKWEQSGGYPWVTNTAFHPDKNFDSVRKWVAPGPGKISIGGAVRKGDNNGDGIQATIKKDTAQLWTATVKSTAWVTPNALNDISVVKGTAIYFIVNNVTSMNNDHTIWEPTISFTGESQASGTPVVQPAAAQSTEISVASCNAVPNDNKDDYAAFVACVDKAKVQKKSLFVPAGTYILSDILTLDGVSMRGAGKGETVLVSTNPNKGSIDLKGSGPKLSHLKHMYQTLVPRGNGANEKNSITVRGATDYVIDNVHVDKASTAGIFVMGAATNGKITNNLVENTNADGIHITDSSSYVKIENNVVTKVGDDTIAVVSYRQDKAAAHHVTITNNKVSASNARGVSVVGGTDIVIEDNSIKDIQMAGVYISVEGSYNTFNVDRVTVTNNVIDHTGIHQPENHPNVLVYGGQGIIDNVTFNGNIIKNAVHRGIGVWGDGVIKNVYFNNNTLIDNNGPATVFKNGKIHLSGNIGF